MIRNYILIALRTLNKQRLFSGINILGLAIGQCAAFLIILFVVDEYRANNWIRNIGNQYMLESEWEGDINRPTMTTLAPLGEALKENYPDLVANYFSIDALSCNISDGQDKSFRMNLQIGKGDFLSMFGLPLIYGNAETAFAEANNIIIQKEVALKFYGRENVIGESLILETQNGAQNPLGTKEYIISGVLDELPVNSITDNLGERTDVYVNADNLLYFRPYDMFADWGNYIIQTRIELQPSVDPEDLQVPINQLITTNASEALSDEIIPKLTALDAYNLTDQNSAKLQLIYVLAAVAGFILLMAMINFVNISLGMAQKRLREIGVRKAMGGLKWHLQAQFISESIVLSLVSLFITFCLIQLVLPSFMTVVGKTAFSNTNMYWLSGCFVLFSMFIGLLSGAYPSFILSSHTPVKALKGKTAVHSKKAELRNVMLTIQYVLALVVITSSIIASEQIEFITTKDKGYNSENVLVVSSVPRWYSADGVQRMLNIARDFTKLPEVDITTLSYEIPDGRHGTMASLREPETGQVHYFGQITADPNYHETYQLELKEGRFFNKSDQGMNRILLNESAAKTLFKDGFGVGESVSANDTTDLEVIGIIKDFHFGTAKQPINGIVFNQMDSTKIFRYLSFKLGTDNHQQAIANVKARWQEVFPLVPFEHFLMEEKLDKLYSQETNFKNALSIASFFAIGIVLIGVFGLTIQNLAYRIKEIGIRRVLGATPFTLFKLFIKQQLLYFAVAMVLATPISYFAIDQWLGDFAYRISQPISIYVLSFSLLVSLALLIVFSQLIRLIRVNPVDSLKYE